MTGIDPGLRRDEEELSPGALTATAPADTANYPFCPIEPNVGLVGPDERFETAARLAKLPKIVTTQCGFC